jgi:hypothetical protein
MALGRARLRYDRQQRQRCRQRDDKHSHDLAPSSHNSQVQPAIKLCAKAPAAWQRDPRRSPVTSPIWWARY